MLSRPALLRPAAAKRRGFTLLELIVVLLILGILAAIAIPTFNRIQQNSVKSSVQTDAEAIARNADGIANSQNGGLVDAPILNLAASEAYGGSETGGTWTFSPGDGKDITPAAGAEDAAPTSPLIISYNAGSTTCVFTIDVANSKALVEYDPNDTANATCPQ